jgi:hypothetical protein
MTKGQDQKAEQDFEKAIELDSALKRTIEKRASEIKQGRKATPKP